jgi:hypothetical protein
LKAIEAGKTFAGANPQEPVTSLNDGRDRIRGQPFTFVPRANGSFDLRFCRAGGVGKQANYCQARRELDKK